MAQVVKNTGLGAAMARLKTIFQRYALKTQVQEVAEALDQKIKRGAEITVVQLTNNRQRFYEDNLISLGDIIFSTSSSIAKVADTELRIGKGIYELNYNVCSDGEAVGLKIVVNRVEQQQFTSITPNLSCTTVLSLNDDVNYLMLRTTGNFSVPNSGVTTLVIRRIS